MKETLQPGIEYVHEYTLPATKTVPQLYPESPEFRAMPEVFATGFMVGFIEWACIMLLKPHLDWPVEQTVGTHINVSHEAASPPGMKVRAEVKLTEVDGRRLVFEVKAYDEADLISKGTHERFVINKEKFDSRVKRKSVSS